MHIRVILKNPADELSTLYAGYAKVMARHVDARIHMEYSEHPDAHGFGYPSVLINDLPVVPADRSMLMPGDLVNELQVWGKSAWELTELADALEAPLNRMLASAAR